MKLMIYVHECVAEIKNKGYGQTQWLQSKGLMINVHFLPYCTFPFPSMKSVAPSVNYLSM